MLDEGAKEPHKFFSRKLQAESLLPLCLEFKTIPKVCRSIALCSQPPSSITWWFLTMHYQLHFASVLFVLIFFFFFFFSNACFSFIFIISLSILVQLLSFVVSFMKVHSGVIKESNAFFCLLENKLSIFYLKILCFVK